MTKFKVSFVGAIAAVFALVASSSADAAYMHSVALKMGSRNAQVMELQKALNATSCKVAASGVGSAGMESMYFGAMTKAAVQCFQAANGLTADGVVGAMTGAKLAAAGSTSGSTGSTTGSTSGSTGSTSGATLTGGAGSVKAYKLVSSLNNEEVGEDEDNAKVAGLEIEADKGSDLRISAVKINFDRGTAGTSNSSTRLEKYADSVSVWFDGKKVAEEDADEFDSTNSYSKTLSLSSDVVIKSDSKAELVVALSGVSNLDSADVAKTWTVDFETVRFVDAQGAVISENPNTDARTFSFESFASATDAELKISLNDDDEDINEAHIIDVDDNSTTTDVSLLSSYFEAKGDSDLWIDEVPVLFTVSGATISEFIYSADLYVGSTKVGSETISGSGTTLLVTFDDLDWSLDAGDKENVYVKVNINKATGNLGDGDTIQADILTAQRDAIVVEDESGEDLVNTDKTGSADGEASAIYDNGIKVTFVSASRSVTTGSSANDDIGTFDIKFKVAAFGDSDVYIPDIASDTGTDAVGFDVDKSGAAQSGVGLSGTVTSNANTSTGGNFKVASGTTRDFTLSVSVTNGGAGALTAGQYRALLGNVRWNTTDNNATFNSYTFNLEDYKTDYIALN